MLARAFRGTSGNPGLTPPGYMMLPLTRLRSYPHISHRLLFASIHSYLDPSNGAALATRELLELLAGRGWDCRAFTCGVLDYQNETPIENVLSSIERPGSRVGAALSLGGEAEVFDLDVDGVRVTLLPTSSSRGDKSPNPRDGAMYLDLATAVLDRFPAGDSATGPLSNANHAGRNGPTGCGNRDGRLWRVTGGAWRVVRLN